MTTSDRLALFCRRLGVGLLVLLVAVPAVLLLDVLTGGLVSVFVGGAIILVPYMAVSYLLWGRSLSGEFAAEGEGDAPGQRGKRR